MEANTRNRTIALAALFQAVVGVIQIAREGRTDQETLNSSLHSILRDEERIEDLFGGLSQLRTGLRALMNQLGSGGLGMPEKDMDTTRYSINLLYLERKLSQDEAMFRQVIDGITDAQRQLEFFPIDHPNISARLAELYTQTISKLGPRIIIKGEQGYLSTPENAAKIRVMLLAGVRAALLWRQAGGSRWKLIFSRSAMQKEAQYLLRGASDTEEYSQDQSDPNQHQDSQNVQDAAAEPEPVESKHIEVEADPAAKTKQATPTASSESRKD